MNQKQQKNQIRLPSPIANSIFDNPSEILRLRTHHWNLTTISFYDLMLNKVPIVALRETNAVQSVEKASNEIVGGRITKWIGRKHFINKRRHTTHAKKGDGSQQYLWQEWY